VATNALNIRMGTAEDSTNALDIRMTTAEGSTNALNIRLTNVEYTIHTGPILTNANSVAIGVNASEGGYGVAMGDGPTSVGGGIAMGRNAYAQEYALSLGFDSQARGWAAISLGEYAYCSNQYAVAIGYKAWAGLNNVAIGKGVTNTTPDTTMLKGDLNMNYCDVTNGRNVYASNGYFATSLKVGGLDVGSSFGTNWEVAISGRVDNLEAATNALDIRMTAAEGATNALNIRMGTAEDATNALDSKAMGLTPYAGTIDTNSETKGVMMGVYPELTGPDSTLGCGLSTPPGIDFLGVANWPHWAIAAGTKFVLGYICANPTNSLPLLTFGPLANSAAVFTYDLNVGGDFAVVSNVSAATLQITGGTPTTGAVFIATNPAGQGEWTVFPGIYAENAGTWVSSADWVNATFPTVVNQIEGTWDGTNWTPGVLGYIAIKARGSVPVALTRSKTQLLKNGVVIAASLDISTGSGGEWSGMFVSYNDATTNKYKIQVLLGGVYTNLASQPMSFTGKVLP